jgi:hypothetical protein
MPDTVVMKKFYVAVNFFTIVLGSNLDQGTECLDNFYVFFLSI